MDFTIYSLGDAAFLYAVINAVSSIPESVYMQLGGVGAIFGLLIMGVKGANEGNLMKAGFQGLIVSLAIFWIMFIPRVDKVVIKDMAPSPTAPPLYVIDNVPAGFAAVGSTMSTLGVYIARLFDQAFGDVDENRVMTGGIGDNLRRITMLRQMADPVFIEASNVESLNRFRSNLAQYMGHCTMTGLSTGELPNRTLSVSTDENGDGVVNALDGMHFPHKALQTRVRDGSNNPQVLSCAEAGKKILEFEGFNPNSNSPKGDPEMGAAFDAALNGRATFESTIDTMERFGMDNAAQWAQSAMINQVVAAATMQSLRTGGNSQGGMLSSMMVEEAAARRNVQFAGEQNMFLRTMRTTIGFFEAVFYALGPIMAILVMTGPMGVTIASKYLMLTVWVLLWYPMLAIINLYGNVKMQTLVTELAANPDYVTSPIGTHQLLVMAQDQLGTIAGLVAATPVLAMSLIYGGAVAMNAVASRLTGGDQINESMVAPQAMETAPALQNQSIANGSVGSTMKGAGGASLQLTDSEGAKAGVQLAQEKAAAANREFMSKFTQGAGTGSSFTVMGGTGEATSDNSGFNRSMMDGVAWASGQNEQFNKAWQELKALDATVSVQTGVNGSTGVMAGGNGVTFTASLSSDTSSRDSVQRMNAALETINNGLATNESLQNAFVTGTARSVTSQSGIVGANTTTDTNSRELADAAKESISSKEALTRSEQIERASGSSQSIDVESALRSIETSQGKDAAFENYTRLAIDAGAYDQYQEALATANVTRPQWSSDQKQLAAFIVASEGVEPSGPNAEAQNRFRQAVLGDALLGPQQSGVDTGRASQLEGQSVPSVQEHQDLNPYGAVDFGSGASAAGSAIGAGRAGVSEDTASINTVGSRNTVDPKSRFEEQQLVNDARGDGPSTSAMDGVAGIVARNGGWDGAPPTKPAGISDETAAMGAVAAQLIHNEREIAKLEDRGVLQGSDSYARDVAAAERLKGETELLRVEAEKFDPQKFADTREFLEKPFASTELRGVGAASDVYSAIDNFDMKDGRTVETVWSALETRDSAQQARADEAALTNRGREILGERGS